MMILVVIERDRIVMHLRIGSNRSTRSGRRATQKDQRASHFELEDMINDAEMEYNNL